MPKVTIDGKEVEVAFYGFIRGEAKFESVEALIDQMGQDCAAAKQILARG